VAVGLQIEVVRSFHMQCVIKWHEYISGSSRYAFMMELIGNDCYRLSNFYYFKKNILPAFLSNNFNISIGYKVYL